MIQIKSVNAIINRQEVAERMLDTSRDSNSISKQRYRYKGIS